MHPAKKGRTAREDGKGNAMARAARKAERELLERSPAARDLPPGEIRPTRAERRARLELQSVHGDEQAKRGADEIRRRARDNEAERERLRPRRLRDHKHLPAGLMKLPFVERKTRRETPRLPRGTAVVSPATKGAKGAKVAIAIRGGRPVDDFKRVTSELARDAAALRTAFDVQTYDAARVTSAGGHMAHAMMVRREVAEAIREAGALLAGAWVSIALSLVTDALLTRAKEAHAAVDTVEGLPRPPTSAEPVHHALIYQMRQLGFPPPPHVDIRCIEWMIRRLAIGVTRGGGRTKKLSAAKMRTILTDPKKVATELARPH